MEALVMSEFYGFARLGFCPSDITVTEEELQKRYNGIYLRVPEFVAGNQMVEVKRINMGFNISSIVKKACEKAHKHIVYDEKIIRFYICYAVPESMNKKNMSTLKKLVRSYTLEYSYLIYAKSIFVMFVRTPDCCFKF